MIAQVVIAFAALYAVVSAALVLNNYPKFGPMDFFVALIMWTAGVIFGVMDEQGTAE